MELDFHKYLRYDPETGKLYWKIAKSKNTKVGQKAGNRSKSNGYTYITFSNKTYLLHRVIWHMHYNEWPEKDLDHINRDKEDNRIENLRLTSHRRNCHNKEVFNGGVYFCRQKNKWHARIRFGKLSKHLGFFVNKSDGQKAYQEALELYNV